MADDKRFTVLVSLDQGVTWRRHAGIIATSGDQAIDRVREGHAETYAQHSGEKGDDSEVALFFATQRFVPRQMRRELVAKWGLKSVDLPDEIAPAQDGEG
jgi:hypothetical protein